MSFYFLKITALMVFFSTLTEARWNPTSENVTQRSERLQKRLIRKLNYEDPNLLNISHPQRGDSEVVVAEMSRYLARFGPQLVRLIKTARDMKLDEQLNQARINAIDQLSRATKSELQDDLRRYESGKIDNDQLRSRLQATLRRQTLASAIIGAGGVGNLTENVLLAVRRHLSLQFQYLDGFLYDISTRTITQKDRARLNLYANSAYAISMTAQRQFNLDNNQASANELEEMRVLGGNENCDDCVEMAGHWEPAGTLPAIGQESVCQSNCRCHFVTRQTGTNKANDAQTSQQAPQAT